MYSSNVTKGKQETVNCLQKANVNDENSEITMLLMLMMRIQLLICLFNQYNLISVIFVVRGMVVL